MGLPQAAGWGHSAAAVETGHPHSAHAKCTLSAKDSCDLNVHHGRTYTASYREQRYKEIRHCVSALESRAVAYTHSKVKVLIRADFNILTNLLIIHTIYK